MRTELMKKLAEDVRGYISMIALNYLESSEREADKMEEIIDGMLEGNILLEKLAEGIQLDKADRVMGFVLKRYEWECEQDDERYEADHLVPLILAIYNDKPIADCYYGDVVMDEFIFDPNEAKEADPSQYVMTREFYRFGLSWFNSSEGFKEEFEEIHDISWERASNEWADQYVSKKWVANDWASYMLDRLEDSYSAGCWRKFPILEWK